MAGSSHRRCLVVMLLIVVLASSYASSAAASTPLAAERTRRKDPLDGLRYYVGGWNISDRHYIAVGSVLAQLLLCFCLYPVRYAHATVVRRCAAARVQSVAFSAAPVFAAAAVWFVAFALLGLVACCCRCCRGKTTSDYTYSRKTFAVSLLLVLAFTATAIIGCAVLYDGQGKLDGSTSATLRYVGGRGGGRAQRAHRQQRAQDPDRAGHHEEDSDRCGSRDARLAVFGACVFVGWAGVSRSLPGISGMDPCCRDIYIVGCFPPLAQRGRGHLRGHGRMGSPATGQHRPGRHPPLRRRGGDHRRPAPEQGGEPPARCHSQRSAIQRLQRQQRPTPGAYAPWIKIGFPL
ncbi:hypothetical protein ACQ4PT_001085 [Festuca glaucescens]